MVTSEQFMNGYRKVRWVMRFFSFTAFKRYHRTFIRWWNRNKIANNNREIMIAKARRMAEMNKVVDNQDSLIDGDTNPIPEVLHLLLDDEGAQSEVLGFKKLEPTFIFGYCGHFQSSSLVLAGNGTILAFPLGSTIICFNTRTGKQKFFHGHGGIVTSLVLIPKKECVVSGEVGPKPKLLVWDVSKLNIITELKEPEGGIRCLAVHPKGTVLVGAGHSNVYIWDITNGYSLVWSGKATVPAEPILGLALDMFSDHTAFVTFGICHARYWKLGEGVAPVNLPIRRVARNQPPTTIKEHVFTSAAFIHRGSCLLGTQQGTIFSLHEGNVRYIRGRAHIGPVLCAVSNEGTVVTGGGDGVVVQWDAKLNQLMAVELHANGSGIGSLSSSENQLAVGTMECDAFELNVAESEAIILLAGHNGGSIVSMKLCPDSQNLITIDDLGMVRSWEPQAHSLAACMKLESKCRCIDVDCEGKKVAIGTDDNGLQLLNPTDLSVESVISVARKVKGVQTSKNCVTAIQFSPSGKFVAASSVVGETFVLSMEDMKLCCKLRTKGEENEIEIAAIDWSLDENVIRTEDIKGNLKHWDLKGKQLSQQEDVASLLKCNPDKVSDMQKWKTINCKCSVEVLSKLVGSDPYYVHKDPEVGTDQILLACRENGVVQRYEFPLECGEEGRLPEPSAEYMTYLGKTSAMALHAASKSLYLAGFHGYLLGQFEFNMESLLKRKFKSAVKNIIRGNNAVSAFEFARRNRMATREDEDMDTDLKDIEEEEEEVPAAKQEISQKLSMFKGAAKKIMIGGIFVEGHEPERKAKLTAVWKYLTVDGRWPSVNAKETVRFVNFITDESEREEILEKVKNSKAELDSDWLKAMMNITRSIPAWKLKRQCNEYLEKNGIRLENGEGGGHTNITVKMLIERGSHVVAEQGGVTTWETGMLLEYITGKENSLQEAHLNNKMSDKQWLHVMTEHLSDHLKEKTGAKVFERVKKRVLKMEASRVGRAKVKQRLRTMEDIFHRLDVQNEGAISFQTLVSFNEMMAGSHQHAINSRATAENMLKQVGKSADTPITMEVWLDLFGPTLSAMTDDEFKMAIPPMHHIIKT